MRHPFFRSVSFGLAGFMLVACLFDGLGGGVTVPPDPKDDEPYIRALLDSNGMRDVPLSEVIKVLDPQSRNPRSYLELGNRGLTEFRFIAAVTKIKAVQEINLISNKLTRVPSGLSYKRWTAIGLRENKLCNLTPQDSAALDAAGAIWKDSQICPRP